MLHELWNGLFLMTEDRLACVITYLLYLAVFILTANISPKFVAQGQDYTQTAMHSIEIANIVDMVSW